MHDYFEKLPKKGHGQARKLALYLEVHTTLISQILKGTKSFTFEQASLVAEFLGFNESESDFFLLLVQLDRAGNTSLRKNLERQIAQKKKSASELSNRLNSAVVMTDEQRAIFYSDWSYSAIRQLTALSGFNSIEVISEYLNLPIKRTRELVDFLLKAGLCIEQKGKLKIGPASTHLESSSPWVRTHHVNWRQKAIEKLSADEPAQLHYTCPMTISKEDALRIREIIVKALENVDKIIEPSPSEDLRCLNIDWFKI